MYDDDNMTCNSFNNDSYNLRFADGYAVISKSWRFGILTSPAAIYCFYRRRLLQFSYDPNLSMTSLDSDGRPLYEEGIDFEALALVDNDFARFYRSSGERIDFQDPEALQ